VETRTLVRTEDLFTNFYTFEGVVRALNGVSLVVNQGETYGLVGESGCGKSVSVRSIMRIVQAPGRIESGKIVIFFSSSDAKNGCEIVGRSEAYMESIRGNDVSMIFQEPGAALNPVLSVSEQVGESFLFHRLDQMLEETVGQLAEERGRLSPVSPARWWKALQSALFSRELAALARFKERVRVVDSCLCEYEGRGDAEAEEKKHELNARREGYRKKDVLTMVASRFPFLRHYRRRLKRTIRAHVVELLRSLGIPNPENVASRYPHELSGGMQQRIVIAIALACHPTLLIADEPTSNLDVTIQAQIVELIKTLKKTSISSVLFITHDLGLVAEVCDRVTVMYAGDVDETASVQELFRNPLHPYSRGLLESVPKVKQDQELTMIPGAVPNLIKPPSGCRYHPRCLSRMDICPREKPSLQEHSPGHWVACHLYAPKEAPHA
jgi:peptide/nickel transport system ATP-binding protein